MVRRSSEGCKGVRSDGAEAKTVKEKLETVGGDGDANATEGRGPCYHLLHALRVGGDASESEAVSEQACAHCR
eukprot:623893-Rhodomonas_salina.3